MKLRESAWLTWGVLAIEFGCSAFALNCLVDMEAKRD